MKQETRDALEQFSDRFMAQKHAMASSSSVKQTGIPGDIRELAQEINDIYLQKDTDTNLSDLLPKIETALSEQKDEKNDPDLGKPITNALSEIKEAVENDTEETPRP